MTTTNHQRENRFMAAALITCCAAIRYRLTQLLKPFLWMLLLSVGAYSHAAFNANVVANGSFEDCEANWTVEEDDTTRCHSTSWDTAHGVSLLVINGNNGPGAIYQEVVTQLGQTYTIFFAYAGDPLCGPTNKTFNVFWDDMLVDSLEFDVTGKDIFNMGWQYYEAQVTASNSLSKLRFESTTPGTCGPALDDVRIVPTEVKLATVSASGGWIFYPFDGGGGSQCCYYSTTSSVDTSHLVNPAPQAVYQQLQANGLLSWALEGLIPSISYKVRVHLSSIEFPNYHKVLQTVWASNGGSPDYVDNVTPYGSGGFNVGRIVEFYHTSSSLGELQGGMTPAGGFYTYAIVSGVEVIKNQ